jgi:hypothetical protein
VLHALRHAPKEAVTPVVAGYLGPPPAWRVALAPLVETARYAADLGPRRLLGWWLWGGMLVVGLHGLRRRGLRPAPVLGRIALAGTGAVLLVTAAPRWMAPPGAAFDPRFIAEIGRYGTLLGALALGCAGRVALMPALARVLPAPVRSLGLRLSGRPVPQRPS